ncbi:MAG: type III-A CRISPR-associated protein Cas10/Csm1, partial [Candidatus Dadabacteria bacterium]
MAIQSKTDDTVLKVAAAGLFHDIGKFAGPGGLGGDSAYRDANESIYLPVYKGRYSHQHALWTAKFIEESTGLIPPDLQDKNWGAGPTFLELSARHHKPENAYEQIITEADRISSGMDRQDYEDKRQYTDPRQYRETRLVSLFEHLSKGRLQSEAEHTYSYKLEPLGPESIFPVMQEPSSGNPAEDYMQLYGRFVSDLERLPSRTSNTELWLEHFDTLFMRYTSFIPAARAGLSVPDISLYDHSRSTAALAAALYLYHRDTNTLEIPAVKESGTEKFLMISGDFSGIQNFIFKTYGASRKYRSKLLRGRSLAVSLYTELAADLICRRIGLPFLSVVFSAGGRFTIIAPNTKTACQEFHSAREDITAWMVDHFYGESTICLSSIPASPDDFRKGTLNQSGENISSYLGLTQKLGKAAERIKFTRFAPERECGVV